LRQPDSIDGLGQRADLVDLDQDRIGNAVADPLAEALCVGDEQIVPDQLQPRSELVGQRLPARHVILPMPSSIETIG
jgi:hypothetical protein